MSNLKEKLVLASASCFFTGYFPYASGTVTTFVIGIPVYLGLSLFPAPVYLLCTVLLTLLSAYVSGKTERILGKKDPGKVTIDEVAGYLTTMAFLPKSWTSILLGFFIFRAFDVLKVFPANWVEKKIPGGWGITLDDIISGIWANLAVRIVLAINILPII